MSLEAVLLHYGNRLPSIPVGHTVDMKETYDNMKQLLDCLEYSKYAWHICSDLKVVALLMGLQLGYTKYCCFPCEWDSIARTLHYVKKDWPLRKSLKIGEKNVQHSVLAEPDKILLPPLHIKLGLMNNLVKAMDQNGSAFKYLSEKFPRISEAKIKEGIFVGPQIRQLFIDKKFEYLLKGDEKKYISPVYSVSLTHWPVPDPGEEHTGMASNSGEECEDQPKDLSALGVAQTAFCTLGDTQATSGVPLDPLTDTVPPDLPSAADVPPEALSAAAAPPDSSPAATVSMGQLPGTAVLPDPLSVPVSGMEDSTLLVPVSGVMDAEHQACPHALYHACPCVMCKATFYGCITQPFSAFSTALQWLHFAVFLYP
ncbi:hypothetical protein P4O66_016453 [Electrophorus voltai]|uniref:Uncharacterized protein n=1 Tax=Electrophorus voltai TaxID=2609070 RepID=A0AAD8YYD7_9TELE|nr:hypothetical protein P4O66_016453 [Electrophorus voltai]